MKQWILLKPQDTNTPSADCDSECLNIGECRQWAKGTQDIYDMTYIQTAVHWPVQVQSFILLEKMQFLTFIHD